MHLRPITEHDREPLASLLERVDNFTADERDVARELIDDSIWRPESSGYRCIVAVDDRDGDDAPVGYICFGHTPMTRHTYDLYWIVVDATRRMGGVGRALLEAMEAALLREGGRRIRVETSSQESYGATQRFYDRVGFTVAGTLSDFYADGDHLFIYYKAIDP